MKVNEQDLKRAFGSHIKGRPGAAGDDCLSAEEIWRLLRTGGSRKKKARMIDHITDCPACHGEFEALLGILRAERSLADKFEVSVGAIAKKPRVSWYWRYAAAVLILLVVAGSVLFSRKWLGPAVRHEERGRLSGQFRLIAPGRQRALQPPLTFKWEGVAGAEYYIVEVFDSSLLPVWKSPPTTQNSCSVPKSADNSMRRNANYYWMLTAFQRDGTKFESSLEEFRLIE